MRLLRSGNREFWRVSGRAESQVSSSSSYFFVVASPISKRRGTTAVQAASWVIFSPLSLSALLAIAAPRPSGPLPLSLPPPSTVAAAVSAFILVNIPLVLVLARRLFCFLLSLAFVFLWLSVAPEESWREEDVNETASKEAAANNFRLPHSLQEAFFLNSTTVARRRQHEFPFRDRGCCCCWI